MCDFVAAGGIRVSQTHVLFTSNIPRYALHFALFYCSSNRRTGFNKWVILLQRLQRQHMYHCLLEGMV